MIADYYPPEKRATAMGFYTLGISAGIMVALVGGGWVVQNIGWREAFFIVGIPGVLLALVVRFTLVEPERGASESRVDSGVQPTLKEVVRFLSSRSSFHHMGIAAGLTAFVGYAVVNWAPSFIARSYGMDLAQLGLWFGIIIGVAGGAGFFFGGYISDKLGQSSRRRSFNFLALSMLLAALCNFAVFMAPTAFWCLVMLVIPTVISNFYLAPVLAQAQGLVSLRMRAVASALVLLIINIIGLAMGPLLTGLLSDALRPVFDNESMRYSLMIVSMVALPWAALHYYLAGRSIEQDLARASEKD